jgi:hypothetical protein
MRAGERRAVLAKAFDDFWQMLNLRDDVFNDYNRRSQSGLLLSESDYENVVEAFRLAAKARDDLLRLVAFHGERVSVSKPGLGIPGITDPGPDDSLELLKEFAEAAGEKPVAEAEPTEGDYRAADEEELSPEITQALEKVQRSVAAVAETARRALPPVPTFDLGHAVDEFVYRETLGKRRPIGPPSDAERLAEARHRITILERELTSVTEQRDMLAQTAAPPEPLPAVVGFWHGLRLPSETAGEPDEFFILGQIDKQQVSLKLHAVSAFGDVRRSKEAMAGVLAALLNAGTDPGSTEFYRARAASILDSRL